MKDLSVIIPAYNCEKYLGRCIESILNQDKLDLEIIVVNDGSTDATLKVCTEYAEKFKNIKVINKKNEGQGVARNQGIMVAEGKYITFVDSDDYVNKNCYTVAVSKLEESNSEYFIGQIKKVSEYETIEVDLKQMAMRYYSYENKNHDLVRSLLTGNNITEECRVSSSSCDKLYLKSIIDKYNLSFCSEREYLSEDMIFNLVFIDKINSCIVSNMHLYNYVTNTESFCHTYQKNYVDKMYKMLDVFKEYSFDFPEQEFQVLVSDKMYGYIKSYMFQEVEHRTVVDSGKNIKNLCKEQRIQKIFLYTDRKNFGLVDYIIVLLGRLKLGLVIAFFYKLKWKAVCMKTK